MQPTFVIALVFAALTSVLAVHGYAEVRVYDGGRDTGYQMFVGDKGNWNLAVGGAEFVSANKRVTLKPGAQAGALNATWKGRGEGQLYFSAPQAQDLSALVASASALTFLVKVDQPPKRQTVLRMGCGYPCAGNADITKLLQALPKSEWLKVSIDMQCFVDQGLDATRIDTPFLLLTTGKLSLEVADIRLVPNLGETATVRC